MSDPHEEVRVWLEETAKREYLDWMDQQRGKQPDGTWSLDTYRQASRQDNALRAREDEDA